MIDATEAELDAEFQKQTDQKYTPDDLSGGAPPEPSALADVDPEVAGWPKPGASWPDLEALWPELEGLNTAVAAYGDEATGVGTPTGDSPTLRAEPPAQIFRNDEAL